jgi:L-ascorbate metabolism protein UlaG (beta-lactamase superfamily)
MRTATSHWLRRHFLKSTAIGTGAALAATATPLLASSDLRFPVSDHCDGKQFFNPRGRFERSLVRLLRWKLGNTAVRWPARVDLTPQLPPPTPVDHRVAATWVNHATFLLQTRQGNFLTDPVWSDRAGPFSFGPRRVHAPGIRFTDLPKIHAVLLSHDHYDHCDLTTLRLLAARDAPVVITPLGHRDLLEGVGFAPDKIVELDWWQAHAPILIGGRGSVRITLTPARHWSNRLTGSANGRLWGGFFLRLNDNNVWFAGDTGYDDQFFHEIKDRLGPPTLALIPIGAYEPRSFMAPVHCNPHEAVRIHQDVGALTSIGMHWGTFQLTDEGREDPVRALAAARETARLQSDEFRVLAPGETLLA